jgi:hypothetical protein
MPEHAPDEAMEIFRIHANHEHHWSRTFALLSNKSLPVGVMPRLLMRLFEQGKVVCRWRNGAVVQTEGVTMRVMRREVLADGELQKEAIVVEVCGSEEATADVARLYRTTSAALENVLTNFYYLDYQVAADCGCSNDGGKNVAIRLGTLREHVLKGAQEVKCGRVKMHRIYRLAPGMTRILPLLLM